jgi:hypothetical protein
MQQFHYAWVEPMAFYRTRHFAGRIIARARPNAERGDTGHDGDQREDWGFANILWNARRVMCAESDATAGGMAGADAQALRTTSRAARFPEPRTSPAVAADTATQSPHPSREEIPYPHRDAFTGGGGGSDAARTGMTRANGGILDAGIPGAGRSVTIGAMADRRAADARPYQTALQTARGSSTSLCS